MQIPNLVLHYAFIYNTLFIYSDIFERLYIQNNCENIVKWSNSYLVFLDTFTIENPYDELDEIEAGVFASRNNKINGSVMLKNNRNRYSKAQDQYLFKMKLDIESFFPNLYTHNFEKIYYKEPFKMLKFPKEYFVFLDKFHQTLNNKQTKGIPAGLFSSHVAAELCMLCVDYQISKRISNKDIGYIRYVDDLTFFSNSKEKLDELKADIQKILNEFRLRINGNKTEISECINDYPQASSLEADIVLNWKDNEQYSFTIDNLDILKRYISYNLTQKNFSQIKTCLTLLSKHLSELETEYYCEQELFTYLVQLLQTEPILSCNSYKLINLIISNTKNKEYYLKQLMKISDRIDSNFSDSILQIWHYYTLYSNYSNKQKYKAIDQLNPNNNNPIILSMLVCEGKNNNKKLIDYIRNIYTNEIRLENTASINDNEWKKTIMFSKWWLPLFIIRAHDDHNYYSFFKSGNFPSILDNFLNLWK